MSLSGNPFDPNRLPLLLSQDESGILEFKRDWYRLEKDPETRNLQKAELVKDILSLANGNVDTAGEAAVLVIGADDQLNEDGFRNVYDVGDNIPTASEILLMVRPFSNPPLDSLFIVPFQSSEKRLFAVVIPPTPHVYETTRELRTLSQLFSKYVVFIRRGDSIDLASAQEREAIRSLKAIRLSETRNAPPVLFGGGVGATIGGVLFARLAGRMTGSKEGSFAGGIVGIVFGGLLGAVMGSTYENLIEATRTWRRLPSSRRLLAVVVSAASATAAWFLSDRLATALTPRKGD